MCLRISASRAKEKHASLERLRRETKIYRKRGNAVPKKGKRFLLASYLFANPFPAASLSKDIIQIYCSAGDVRHTHINQSILPVAKFLLEAMGIKCQLESNINITTLESNTEIQIELCRNLLRSGNEFHLNCLNLFCRHNKKKTIM